MDNERRKLAEDILNIWNPGGQCLAAESWTNKAGKKGYSPICNNKFNKELCLIGDGQPKPCSRCKNSSFRTVDIELVEMNFSESAKNRLGIYPLVDSNKCYWVAADIDKHRDEQEPVALLNAMHEICTAVGIPVSVFRSQSGKGFHVYIFFSEIVPAKTARALLLGVIQRAKKSDDSVSASAFDGVFPKQDNLNTLDIGNLIAMPFNGNAFSENSGSCYVSAENGFEFDANETLETNIELFLEEYQTISANDAESLISQMGFSVDDFQLAGSGKSAVSGRQFKGTKSDNEQNDSDFKTLPELINECEFLRHCRDDAATLSEPEWHCMIQVLVREHLGVPAIHELSKTYPRYDKTETDNKILQTLAYQPGPVTCRHIKTIYDCGKDCQVSCPVHLRSSSQRFKKSETEIDTEDWVQSIVFGVPDKGDALRATISRLAGYYIGRFAGNEQKVTETLYKWNLLNDHPVPESEIDDLIKKAGDCKGREAFSEMIGFRIPNIERRISPDSMANTTYRLYVEGEDRPVDLVFANFCNPSAFQKAFGAYVNYLCSIPTGKGAAVIWRETVNNLLSEVTDIFIEEEDTELSVLRKIISQSVENFRRTVQPDDDLYERVGKYVTESEGKLYLSLNSIMERVKFDSEIGTWTRNEVTKALVSLGFGKPKQPIRFGSGTLRLWTIETENFYKQQKG